MSDQRPEWMPTYGELEWDREQDTKSPFVCPNADKRHAKTGLRAQIAVLEEIREPLTDEMTGAADAIIFAKLCALRKELENG